MHISFFFSLSEDNFFLTPNPRTSLRLRRLKKKKVNFYYEFIFDKPF